MAVAKFLLEHFYYGQLVHNGKPAGDPRILASSKGVSDEVAKLALERVSLPPLNSAKHGTWALVRGRDRNIPFLMVQTQRGEAGQLISHYILPSGEVLRAIAGDVNVMLDSFIEETLPVYETIGDPLKSLELKQPKPVAVGVQVDAILELMTITHNKIPLLESLLATIVQGTQLIIQGAPPDLLQRMAFIEGLLVLLPPSARFGVTFTTHSLPSTDIDAQIRFYSEDALPPPDTAVFNWAKGEFLSEKVQDDYSRYVISQLRLDAELVIKRTTALTGIAGWRLNQGEKLADALAYASQRLRVDEALQTNQPINKDEVARILSEDPTLTPELQILYAQHLIRFSLAMEDMSHANPVAILLRQNADLERAILQQMEDAYTEGLSWLLYDTLVSWMSNPLGPQGEKWVSLLQRTGSTLFGELVEDQDYEEINEFLSTMQHASMNLPMEGMISPVIEKAMPIAGRDVKITENLFLLAVKFLDANTFEGLMRNQAFSQNLPIDVRRIWSAIDHGADVEHASKILVKIAHGFGEEWQNVVLLRFAQLAAQRNEFNLLEAPTLASIKDLAISQEAGQYATRILTVINTIEEAGLSNQDKISAFLLLQIRLALGDYHEVGRQMIQQSATFYPGDLQIEYLKMSQKLFEDTPLPADQTHVALQAINDAGVKSAPYITACTGALAKQSGTEDLDTVAGQVADALFGERRLLEVIPSRAVLSVMSYHARRKDVANTIRTASLVPISAAYHEKGSVRVMAQMYKRMAWDERTRIAALQMLRAYIREAQDTPARKAVVYFGKELGKEVRGALETTYRMKKFLGEVSLLSYAEHLHTAVVWLQDCTEAYLNQRNTPSGSAVASKLNKLSGNLTSDEWRSVGDALLRLIQAIVILGKHSRSNRSRDETRYINSLLTGERDPASILDIYLVIGGYFARGKYFKLELREHTPPDPIGPRALPNLRDAIIASHAILGDAINAFPVDKPIKMSAKALRDDIESMWSLVSTEQQTDMVRQIATDFQALVDLIIHIEANSDERAADTNSRSTQRLESAKGRPKDTLEFLRYLRGYFLAKA